jgi:hypothetical protein
MQNISEKTLSKEENGFPLKVRVDVKKRASGKYD